MCLDIFGGQKQPVDNSAEVARQKEQERQARIASGQGAIDSAFSIFDPQYFQNFAKTYTDYYNPQADEQFGKARQNLRYDFARKGTLNSTPAQSKFGDLLNSYSDARDQIAANAQSATDSLRAQVDQNKGALYNQNAAAADPSAAAVSAAGSVGSLTTAPNFSPLADLFGGLINTGASYAAGRQNRLPAGYEQAFNPGAAIARGTGRVVN